MEFSEVGIDLGNRVSGQVNTLCPQCSHNRKKKNDPCLSVNIDEGLWNCHHCGWKGALKSDPLPSFENSTSLTSSHIDFLFSRNISQETLNKNHVYSCTHFMPQVGKEISVIAFPYCRSGEVVNIKYRDLDKNFSLKKGAQLIPYNLDGLKGVEECIIVEGEIDALTMIQLGFTNTISVPTGASKGKNNLTSIKPEYFKDIKRILIATDNDEPGNKLANDLATHLGIERCERAEFDFKDVNELYCNTGKVEFNDFRPFAEILKEEIQQIWGDILIDTEPEDDKPLLYIDKVPVLIEGNHTLVVGKKKSRKTLFLVWLLSLYEANDCLYFDTEQGKKHVWKIREKIKKLNGSDLPVFFLRGMSPKDRREIIYKTVESWPTRPRIVIIDGIRDLMSNINDPDESTELIVWLEGLIKDFNIGVVNVLHLNKTDNNARGHVGTELLNKCYMAIELEKDEQSGTSIVKCADSRDLPFEPFTIQHGNEGLPEVLGAPLKGGNALTEDESKKRLEFVFDGEALKRKDLVEGIKQHFEVGRDRASKLLATYQRKGWVVKNGKDRSPQTVYKLI